MQSNQIFPLAALIAALVILVLALFFVLRAKQAENRRAARESRAARTAQVLRQNAASQKVDPAMTAFDMAQDAPAEAPAKSYAEDAFQSSAEAPAQSYAENAFRADGGESTKPFAERPAEVPRPATEAGTSARPRDTATTLQLFIARCARFATGHKLELVLPGTVAHGTEHCRLTCLLVGPGGVLGIKSLSFSGEVQGNVAEVAWTRTENGETKEFRNPVLGCDDDCRILTDYLAAHGFRDVPVDCVPVFIHPKVAVNAPARVRFFSDITLFEALEQGNLLAGEGCDPAALALALRDGVARPGQ